MLGSNEDDPTCVTRMLEEFRSSSVIARLKNRRSGGPSYVVTRLEFESPSTDRSTVKRHHNDGSEPESAKKFKERDINDSFTDPLSSPWESRRLRGELVEAKTEIAKLEGRINKLHGMRMKLEVEFESEKRDLLDLVDRERGKVKEMEKRMKVLKRRELDARGELEDFRECADSLRFKLENSVQSLQQENEELRDRLMELEMGSRQSLASSDQRVDELESELKHMQEETTELQERCSRLEEKASEAVRQLGVAEQRAVIATKLQLRVAELESELEAGRETVAAVQAQHQKLTRLPDLEREVATLREELAHLREAVPQKLLLEEMVQDLKKRLKHTEEVERQLAEAQEARDSLEARLSEWRQVAAEHCGGGAVEPAVVRKQLGDLQRSVLVATDDLAQARSQLKQSEASREALLFKVETAKQAEEKQRQQSEQQSQLVRRLQKKLLLITRERDSYRSQLDAYEKELTVTPTSHTQQLRARVESLEKAVDCYRDMVERLEVELESALGATGTAGLLERARRLESERDALQRDKQQLAQRRDELERQLEHRALQGDYDPGASKLLHFRLNPAAEAEAKREAEFESLKTELENLKAERDNLQVRVTMLEEMNRPEDLTERVQQKITLTASKEKQELQEQIKSSDLKLQRYMEVFRTSIKEFREVCYTLLGYKVDRIESNHYKLTSVFARSPDDHLMFKVLPNGEVNLLETEFSASLGELIEKYLHQQNSFPMFLSAVNMDLFSQQ